MIELTELDMANIISCVRAIAEGPFLPDGEFSIVMGVERQEVVNWLAMDERMAHEETEIIINNSLNNLIGYPHRKEEKRLDMTGLDKSEIKNLLRKFRDYSRLGDASNYIEGLL